MKKEAIESDKAAKAIGPYSQAIATNGFIFTSGQIPLLPDGSMVSGDIQAQTRQCLENIKAILQAKGVTMEHLVKCTVFVVDMADFKSVNDIYSSYFNGMVPPARSFIQVTKLPKDARVEIEGIAVL